VSKRLLPSPRRRQKLNLEFEAVIETTNWELK